MLRIEREEMKIKIEEIRREVTEVELLPCPFCGEEDLKVMTDNEMNMRYGGIRAVVMCNTCRAQGAIAKIEGFESEAKREAIKLWNRRSTREG